MTRSVVWILGAGFSAGLGAPVLKGLMSEHAVPEVRLRFPHKPEACTGPAVNLVGAFHYGHAQGMWQDAEEFLDYVDTAVHDKVRAELIANLAGGDFAADPAGHAAALKRFVAARCSLFLEGANLSSELWAPYLRWARALQSEDSVITFNWDVVLEKIAAHESSALQVADARARKRPPTQLTDKSFDSAPSPGVVPVLKLHGSIAWRRKGNHYQNTPDQLFALGCKPDQSAIATPGPGKRQATETFLEPLWKRAEAAIRDAMAVVFLGYRFPPSDSHAREVLLTALSAVPAEDVWCRSIHTVLGPNLAHEDSARLGGLITGMLETTGWHNFANGLSADAPSRFRLRQHPLYGQDFLSVFDRDWLFSLVRV